MSRRAVTNEDKRKDEHPHDEVNRFADPKVIGPGEWIVIHTLAFNAKTPEEKKSFCRNFRLIINTFRCSNCRQHAIAYIESNPPEIHARIIVEKGHEDTTMFRYTWEFHNTVNKRLGKPKMSWEQAYKEYSNPTDMFCNTHCGGPTIAPTQKQVAGIIPSSDSGKFDIDSLKSNRLIKISSRRG